MDDVIKEQLANYKNKYLLSDLDKIIHDIQCILKDVDPLKVKRHVCNFVYIDNDVIIFNITKKSKMKYSEIKKKIEETEDVMFSIKSKSCETEDIDEIDKTNNKQNLIEYKFPQELITFNKTIYDKFKLSDSEWIHDIQVDDIQDDSIIKIVDYLMNIEYPEQRSKAWFELREGKITASDGGCVVGMNEHEPPYKFIFKKVFNPPFTTNEFCFHGKKFEKIATLLYEYRKNVIVEDFGLVAHKTCNFLAASPDGIVGKYKLDGKHKTKFIGRMLEIKCPFKRFIKTSGNIKGEICPIYYWIQVQLQLECCDLEKCDFLQCDIGQYENLNDFLCDTDLIEPFRSKTTGMEKGCLIQLMPCTNKNDEMEEAIWIYPPKIEMTPYDCMQWITTTISNIHLIKPNYYIDKIVYWKLKKLHCVTIERDKEWFKENYHTYEKMWKYVVFLRSHKDVANKLHEDIENMPIKSNIKIMKIIEQICS